MVEIAAKLRAKKKTLVRIETVGEATGTMLSARSIEESRQRREEDMAMNQARDSRGPRMSTAPIGASRSTGWCRWP